MNPTPSIPLILLAVTLSAGADTGVIDLDVVPALDGPRRSATMVEVEARFGVPQNRTGPIGDPPITVWHYERFKVYFEHDRVLLSTRRKRPQPSGAD